MRLVRLFGVVLTILTAGLVLAYPAGAQPPSKLTDHVTDSTGVLTDSNRAAVTSAIDRLSRDRHIQLWVVYVDNFSRFKPDNWANGTRTASGMGDRDALLAVAVNTKLYAFDAPPTVRALTAADLDSLPGNRIEPAVNARDWSGAAVAAADALDQAPSSPKPRPIWPMIAIGVAVVVVVVLAILLYRRRRRRRVGPSGAPQSIEAGDQSLPQALSTADGRLRQISDYVARHRETVHAEAKSLVEEAKRHLAAARGKEATNDAEAIAHANRASTLAAEAQSLANADVLAAHRARRRPGTASTR